MTAETFMVINNELGWLEERRREDRERERKQRGGNSIRCKFDQDVIITVMWHNNIVMLHDSL